MNYQLLRKPLFLAILSRMRQWMARVFILVFGFSLGIAIATPLYAKPYCNNYRAFVGADVQRAFFTGKDYRPVYLSTTVANTLVPLGYLQIEKGQLKNYDNGFSFYVGYNMYNFGFQAGYTHLNAITYPYYGSPVTGINFYAKQKGNNIYLDFIYFCQLSCRNVIQASVGVGSLKTYIDYYFTSTEALTAGSFFDFQVKNSRIGPRAGIGWQYIIDRNWAVAFNYRYQLGNALYQNMQTIALGINYYFL